MPAKKLVMLCSDFGLFRDKFTFEGSTHEEILEQAKAHAYEEHGMSKKAKANRR